MIIKTSFNCDSIKESEKSLFQSVFTFLKNLTQDTFKVRTLISMYTNMTSIVKYHFRMYKIRCPMWYVLITSICFSNSPS